MSYLTQTVGINLTEAVKNNVRAMANCPSIINALNDVYHGLVVEKKMIPLENLPEEEKEVLRDIVKICDGSNEDKRRYAKAILVVNYYGGGV